MADDFYLSGLDKGRWFSKHFIEEYQLFGYIGDRGRLTKFQEEKPFYWRLIEIVVPRAKIYSLIKLVSGFDLSALVPNGGDNAMAKQIIDLLNEHRNNKTLSQFLKSVYKNCTKQGRYFDSISHRFDKHSSLYEARMNELSDNLLVVEGHLVHRSTIAQYNSDVAQSLRASKGEWVLSDCPPHAMVKANRFFKGQLLLLKEDDGFTKAFAEYLPFCPQIGWFPYCRIVGFFNSAKQTTEVYPTLSVSLVEYRRPRLFTEVGGDIIDFLKQEINHKNYLKEWSENVLAGYLIPLIRWGSNLNNSKPDEHDREILMKWQQEARDVPAQLESWYRHVL
jgi:hypothetical protein